MVVKCNCKNEYQDKKYGNGMRVHNKIKDSGCRCTVCKDEKKITNKELTD